MMRELGDFDGIPFLKLSKKLILTIMIKLIRTSKKNIYYESRLS